MYFQGKVSKSTRKLLAGASLLLAVKFSSDTKRQNIKNLIEVRPSLHNFSLSLSSSLRK